MWRWILGVAIAFHAGSARAACCEQGDGPCTTGGVDPGAAVVFLRQGATACAGSFIDGDGTILTSYHCVADGGRVRVETRDGRRGVATVRRRLPRQDLALLDAPDFAGEPTLALSPSPPTQGTAIEAWGHPLGSQLPGGFLQGTLRWSVSQGVVAAVGATSLQITAAVNAGNSGGPVVDARGCQVGVVSRRLRAEALGFATRSDHALELVDSARRGPVLGGSLRAEVLGSLWEGQGGAIALGGNLELAVRDRIVVRGSYARALQPTLSALRFGVSSWVGPEGVIGLRQRVGHGIFSARLDLYGGLAGVQQIVRVGEPGDLRTTQTMLASPILGARVGLVNVVLDGAMVRDVDGALRGRFQLGLQWPGRLTVY
ncbi:MAG: serine protease [Deltaproteobacteria bacterium]|nr:MAG: serine protease [Deltaproteobacteria bacterium]